MSFIFNIIVSRWGLEMMMIKIIRHSSFYKEEAHEYLTSARWMGRQRTVRMRGGKSIMHMDSWTGETRKNKQSLVSEEIAAKICPTYAISFWQLFFLPTFTHLFVLVTLTYFLFYHILHHLLIQFLLIYLATFFPMRPWVSGNILQYILVSGS